MRTETTVAEKILWEVLRKDACDSYRFVRQHPNLPEVQVNDRLRQKTLEERGLHVLRLTNQEVLTKSAIELRQIVFE